METSNRSKMSHDEIRKLLGAVGVGLSHVEIERLRDIADRLADIAFDAWLRKRNKA